MSKAGNHQCQLYRADHRGGTESEMFRRQCTFNFDGYYDVSRKPLGLLEAWNEETLAAGKSLFRNLKQNRLLLLLPLVGEVAFKDSLGRQDLIKTEEIGVYHAGANTTYELENPFANDLVHYLQIWLEPTAAVFTPGFVKQSFSLARRNLLCPVFEDRDTTGGSWVSIGLFDQRQSGQYQCRGSRHALFVFVVSGALECDEKLLETRDALSICQAQSIEFEALSQDALFLLLEVPL